MVRRVLIRTLCIFSGIVLTGFIVYCIFISTDRYYVTDTTITVQATGLEYANKLQSNADVNIFSVNGKMYYYIECWPGSLGTRSKFDRKLCTIEDGKIRKISDITTLYGFDQRYIYGQLDGMLIAYDTQSNTTQNLAPLSEDLAHKAVVDPDGTLRVMADKEKKFYFVVKDGRLLDTHPAEDVYAKYELGEKQYSVRKNKVFCQGEDISEQFGSASFRALIPYQDGLLLINDGYGSLVYYIQADGTISSLFQEIPCMCTTSSINFYENYVFVSFKRWEGYAASGFGMKSFENDTLEGTYRINMADQSVEKISNNIYNGMFIFDDSGIYACNRDGDIHHLDFDGNVINLIVD